MEQSGSETQPTAAAASGHNSKEQMASLVRAINNDLNEVQSRIAVLMEERKKIKGRIKAELGWKVADFNAMKRLADLEQEDRDQMLDTIRIGFDALSIGMQHGFLDVLAPEKQPAPAKPSTRKTKTPPAKSGDVVSPGARPWEAKDAYIAGYNTGIMSLDADPRPAQIKANDHELLRAYDRGHEDGTAAAERGEELDVEHEPELPEDLKFDA